MATSKINTNGMIPDYANAATIALPYTATNNGLVSVTVGDGSNYGTRIISVDGVAVGTASGGQYMKTNLSIVVGKGQVVTIDANSFFSAKFIPFK